MKPRPVAPTEWLRTLAYVVRGHGARFLGCVVLGLLSNGFISAANPLALQYLFDEGIIRGDFRRFALLSVGFMALFTLWRVAVYFYRLYVQSLKNTVFSSLSRRMLEKFYRIPYGEVIRRDRGYFLSRIYDEVLQTAPLVMDTTLSLANLVVVLATALAVAVSISFRATLTVFAVVPVVYALSRRYSQRIRRESVAEKEEEARVRGVLERAVGSYKTARIFGLETHASSRFTGQVDTFVSAFFARFKSSTRYETLSGIFTSYVENIAIVTAGYEILAGRMTFGGFMGFMSAFWGVMGAVRGLFGRIPELSRASGMVDRLQEFERIADDATTSVSHAESLHLDGVTFGYGGHDVLSRFDLAPDPGERILVVGPNGSGKSTLAHLVSGLLEPSTGTTTTLPLDRISAAILPYDFVPGTVRDNLGFVGPDPERRIETLARRLGVTGYLDRDPAELSAGQRKRVEILMVLAKPAALYILDEPLAGIDVHSKVRVMETVFELTDGKTLMVIMHGDSEFHARFDRVIDLALPSAAWVLAEVAV